MDIFVMGTHFLVQGRGLVFYPQEGASPPPSLPICAFTVVFFLGNFGTARGAERHWNKTRVKHIQVHVHTKSLVKCTVLIKIVCFKHI